MRVIVPWTRWPHDIWDAMEATEYRWERRHVAGSDRAYFDLLSELWADGETFCIVEHDVMVHAEALANLETCPHDWCGFPHLYMGKLTHSLGCVKFSASLIARNPDALIKVGVMSDPAHPRKHWCRLDAWLQGVVLPNAGEMKHEHLPAVGHLGHGCSHGCTTTS